MNAATRDCRVPSTHRISARNATQRISNALLGVALAAIILGLTAWLQERSDRAAAEETALRAALHETVTVSLADCPPPMDGDPGVLLFFITTRGDAGPRVEGCSRIAARSTLH